MKMQIKSLTLKWMKERTVMLSFFISYLQVSASLFKLRGNSQFVRTIFFGNAEMDTKRLKLNELMELLRILKTLPVEHLLSVCNSRVEITTNYRLVYVQLGFSKIQTQHIHI